MREAGLARAGRRLAAEPFRLAADLVGDRLLPAGLAFEKLLAPLDELVVGAGDAEVAAGVDAADLDHLVGDRPQERPVVGGDEVAERGGPQQPLQPDDARQVEMVGRLVEQQQVGPADQFAGQGQPLAPAAGEDVGRLVGVGEADLRQGDGGPGFALVVLDRLRRRGRRAAPRGRSGRGRRRRPGRDSRGGRCGAATRCRRRAPRGRPAASAASICRSRWGRSGRRARRPKIEGQVGKQRPGAVALVSPCTLNRTVMRGLAPGGQLGTPGCPAASPSYCSQNEAIRARAVFCSLIQAGQIGRRREIEVGERRDSHAMKFRNWKRKGRLVKR